MINIETPEQNLKLGLKFLCETMEQRSINNVSFRDYVSYPDCIDRSCVVNSRSVWNILQDVQTFYFEHPIALRYKAANKGLDIVYKLTKAWDRSSLNAWYNQEED